MTSPAGFGTFLYSWKKNLICHFVCFQIILKNVAEMFNVPYILDLRSSGMLSKSTQDDA